MFEYCIKELVLWVALVKDQNFTKAPFDQHLSSWYHKCIRAVHAALLFILKQHITIKFMLRLLVHEQNWNEDCKDFCEYPRNNPTSMSRNTIDDKTSQVMSGLKILIFKAGKFCAREFTWSHNANVNAKFAGILKHLRSNIYCKWPDMA